MPPSVAAAPAAVSPAPTTNPAACMHARKGSLKEGVIRKGSAIKEGRQKEGVSHL